MDHGIESSTYNPNDLGLLFANNSISPCGLTASARPYRCPGCDQELRASSPHVVVWPEGRPDDRRHWHTACWAARTRRGVKVHRSKNAPRYG